MTDRGRSRPTDARVWAQGWLSDSKTARESLQRWPCASATRFSCSRICDIVGEHATRESMASLRDDIADIEARLGDAEATARDLPHREKYLQLALGFMRRLLELHLDPGGEVERELAPRRPNSAPKA